MWELAAYGPKGLEAQMHHTVSLYWVVTRVESIGDPHLRGRVIAHLEVRWHSPH
jgi:hypothetical protein